ncbi:hypothetical protein [Burkholderia vietnamiensis]|uniref:hypothetical protein n=1 Tax=Burkholderia vietnamiensis TaxID=60552 RepID=UPI0012D8B1AB|nr:hypothetical protein [Burkholderia vietnamiensis]
MSFLTVDIPAAIRDPLELVAVDEWTHPDWDGEGARAVSDATIERAEEFLKQLPSTIVSGDAMAGVDGSLGIYWTRESFELYVDFRADGRTRFYFSDGQARHVERVIDRNADIVRLFEAIESALQWFDISQLLNYESAESAVDNYNIEGNAQYLVGFYDSGNKKYLLAA